MRHPVIWTLYALMVFSAVVFLWAIFRRRSKWHVGWPEMLVGTALLAIVVGAPIFPLIFADFVAYVSRRITFTFW